MPRQSAVVNYNRERLNSPDYWDHPTVARKIKPSFPGPCQRTCGLRSNENTGGEASIVFSCGQPFASSIRVFIQMVEKPPKMDGL